MTINITIRILEDSDGDGKPNLGTSNWVEDLDDDDDGYPDLIEEECKSDPLDPSNTPKLDEEGNCMKESTGEENPPTPGTTANVYYWCILPLAIILVVFIFNLMANEREKQLKDEEENVQLEDSDQDDEI